MKHTSYPLTRRHTISRFLLSLSWMLTISLFIHGCYVGLHYLVTGFQSGQHSESIMIFLGWSSLVLLLLSLTPLGASLSNPGRKLTRLPKLGIGCLIMIAALIVAECHSLISFKTCDEAIRVSQRWEQDSSPRKWNHSDQLLDLTDQFQREVKMIQKAQQATRASVTQRIKAMKVSPEEEVMIELRESKQKHMRHQNDDLKKDIMKEKQWIKSSLSLSEQTRLQGILVRLEALDQNLERLEQETEQSLNQITGSIFNSKKKQANRIKEQSKHRKQALLSERAQCMKQLEELEEVCLQPTSITEMQKQLKSSQMASGNLAKESRASAAIAYERQKEFIQEHASSNDPYHTLNSVLRDAWVEAEHHLAADIAQLSSETSAERHRHGNLKNKDLDHGIIEEVQQKHTQNLYFRLASWFSKLRQEAPPLPSKRDYRPAIWLLFFPMGGLYALSSITLAYFGTSLTHTNLHSGEKQKKVS